MVKWTAPDLYLGSSESDTNMYTNFEFCEEINSQTFKRHIDLQSQAIYDDKKKIHEKSTYLRRRCMCCASRWYWTSNCLKFV